jgi:glycosyltransferase involved in cell wall biosynthesis
MVGPRGRAARGGQETRIALVYDVLYPWVRGGAEKRYWEVARRLPAHGFEPHLIGPKYWDGPIAIQRDGVWLHGICPPRDLYNVHGTRTIGEAIAFARDLFPALLRLNVDLIDCCAFPYFPFFSARAVAGLRRVPMLTTWPELWGPYWRSYLGPIKGTIAQAIESATVRLSRQHLCPSPFTERRLRAGASTAQIRPIPAGIDAAALARHAAPLAQREGVIFIGRLLAHKRVADLLQALALVRRTHPLAHLAIVGQGPEEARLRALAHDLGLERCVTFMANLDDQTLYTLLGRARCLVLPSEREGQGMVVAEAQATGTPPIVATGPETAASDFVRHGMDGLTYAVGDVPALARALRDVLGDPEQWMRLADGARRTASRLDWDATIVPRIVTYYRASMGAAIAHRSAHAALHGTAPLTPLAGR